MLVGVVSKTGKQLMPCHPARARKLVRKGLALRRFKAGIFYIQLTQRTDGVTQDVAVGIDPGSKREGFTVKSESHTYCNILSDAVTWVKDSVGTRRTMRRGRRFRNTPYRKCRFNRTIGSLSPSTKARWQAKLRILDILAKLYPIKFVIVEDIKAKTWKNAKRWNTSFSPVEVGKHWFYEEIKKRGFQLDLKQGWETFELRESMGLKKIKEKLKETFEAHNIDSWVLANWKVGGHTKPDMISLVKMEPIQFHRRQLHAFQFSNGGKRRNYGGTMSQGLKRGSLVKHNKYGITYVGGYSKTGISLHNIESGDRVCRTAKVKDLVKLCFNYWRTTAIPLCAKATQSPCR
jgi:hypothetical protein